MRVGRLLQVDSVSAAELGSTQSIELTLEPRRGPLGLSEGARTLEHRLVTLVVNDDDSRTILVLR
jgi:hypothetical protein